MLFQKDFTFSGILMLNENSIIDLLDYVGMEEYSSED